MWCAPKQMLCTNLIFRNCSCPSFGKTGKFSVCSCHLHYYIPQQLPPVSILLSHLGLIAVHHPWPQTPAPQGHSPISGAPRRPPQVWECCLRYVPLLLSHLIITTKSKILFFLFIHFDEALGFPRWPLRPEQISQSNRAIVKVGANGLRLGLSNCSINIQGTGQCAKINMPQDKYNAAFRNIHLIWIILQAS